MKNLILIAAALVLMSGCTSLNEAIETPPTYDTEYPPALDEMNFQSDGMRLNGLMYVADGPGPHPTVLLLHGFPGNEKNLDLAQALRADGFNVLFFHYRGAWGSEGTFSFTHVIEDVAAATDFVRANAETYRTDPDKLILIGHSMGGFAALAAGAKDETIACTAGLAPANFGVVANVLAADPDRKAGFIAYGDSLQMLAGTDGATLVSELIDNSEAFDALTYAPSFANRSVLIVGADKDEAVPLDAIVRPLIETYKSEPGVETTGIVLPGDHSFSWSREALIDTVLDWAEGCR
ncbi:MAG: alpha/beta fold hydrolase [Hyphomonas sp.]|jgi:pimeloyl-ACP methyl ester carboxylesterase|uniref:alpha/beta hydrolase family protein n=2 Tax=Hyphomonas sp. TaxID=87 RepID=UPI0032630E16